MRLWSACGIYYVYEFVDENFDEHEDHKGLFKWIYGEEKNREKRQGQEEEQVKRADKYVWCW